MSSIPSSSASKTMESIKNRHVASHYRNLANKLQDGIENCLSKGEKAAVRWIWELLQNAKDATEKGRQVEVEIVITKDDLVFSHSGNPFSENNLYSLINQVTSKDR